LGPLPVVPIAAYERAPADTAAMRSSRRQAGTGPQVGHADRAAWTKPMPGAARRQTPDGLVAKMASADLAFAAMNRVENHFQSGFSEFRWW
jgi:hypothetical protein